MRSWSASSASTPAGVKSASADSPVLRARAVLGERFSEVAAESMRERLKSLLAGDRREELRGWLQVPGGEALFTADVLAGTYADLIARAGLPPIPASGG